MEEKEAANAEAIRLAEERLLQGEQRIAEKAVQSVLLQQRIAADTNSLLVTLTLNPKPQEEQQTAEPQTLCSSPLLYELRSNHQA